VGGEPLAAHLHLVGGDRHFLVAHPARERVGARYEIVAGEVELHLIDSVLQEHADRLPHAIGTIHHAAERHLRKR
jgi:hypothetical protein